MASRTNLVGPGMVRPTFKLIAPPPTLQCVMLTTKSLHHADGSQASLAGGYMALACEDVTLNKSTIVIEM